MGVSVFLSHNHKDKPFVRKLARDLKYHGVSCWLDEDEIKVGDALIHRIREGIDSSNYFAIVLSANSVNAPWVRNELDTAMNHQINGKSIKVLPIMLEECEPPSFLVGKMYADFTKEENYEDSFKQLINSMGLLFNANVMTSVKSNNNLGTAQDKAISIGLPIMCKPFHSPFQYIGFTLKEAEKEVGVDSNDVGNIIVEDEECRMLLEANCNFISYVEVDIKRTAPHYQNQEFDSETVLGALSIGLSELELKKKITHYHKYYDHIRKLKVSVACHYDGAPLTVAFSSKYYGM